MTNVHKYDGFSDIHNFFFHPLHRKSSAKKALAVITNIFLTVVSAGLWQVPFWIVNRLDHRKVSKLTANKGAGVNKVFQGTVNPGKNVGGNSPSTPVNEVGDTGTTPVNIPEMAFGEDQWKYYFGEVGRAPPLPPNINDILAAPCPIFRDGRTVGETHMLVLIPKTVNGSPLTLDNIGTWVENPKTGPSSKLDLSKLSYYNTKECDESHWVLMTKDVIPGTRGKGCGFHINKLKEYDGYTVPSARDAAISLLMHRVRSEDYLFSANPKTYTTCQFFTDEDQVYVTIGEFSDKGLKMPSGSPFSEGFNSVGVAAAKRL